MAHWTSDWEGILPFEQNLNHNMKLLEIKQQFCWTRWQLRPRCV